MKKKYLLLIALCVITAVLIPIMAIMDGQRTSGKIPQAPSTQDSTEIITQNSTALEHLPDTTMASASKVKYQIERLDTLSDGVLDSLDNKYDKVKGVLTFRQNPSRNPSPGRISTESPQDIVLDWTFKTDADMEKTDYGVWYGGTGWTGQPLYVEWEDKTMEQIRTFSKDLTPNFSNREIILGSLCSNVYFIDYQSGKMSRKPFKVGNVLKGTTSLDPRMNGNLYIGHGVPKKTPFGCEVFDLVKHQEKKCFGADYKAYRGWNAYDSSPIVVGQFLFWPSENGSLYKFSTKDGDFKRHTILRYKVDNKKTLGIENSMAVYRNYGYFGDNSGNILCVNLNTMKPVWHYDNIDDIDASIVIDEQDPTPALYAGCEVDKQGGNGFSYFAKLNALNGKEIWRIKYPCSKTKFGNKTLDGGMFATPLLGKGDCTDLIFIGLSINVTQKPGALIAIDRKTGKIVYQTTTKSYIWSSPVAFLTPAEKMYIFSADTQGNVYLIEGRTGKIIVTKKIGGNFESSPVVVDSTIVVGSRGREIYKLTIK